MNVEESMHVVFDETNPKLQDQMLKNADDEDIPFDAFKLILLIYNNFSFVKKVVNKIVRVK